MIPQQFKNFSDVSEIDLNDPENFMDTQEIYLGILTKRLLKKFGDDRDITEKQFKDVPDAAHYYFKSSLEYVQNKFSLNDPLICNAVWVNVQDRLNAKYFFNLFLDAMSGISPDDLYEEFLDYQTLHDDDDFPDEAWEETKLFEGVKDENDEPLFHHRINVL